MEKNGLNIIGANNSSYSLNNLSLSDNKSTFTVDLNNDGGTTTSASATLTVLQLAPTIITAPSSQTVVAGQITLFSVTAAGYPALSYQWFKNGNLITGATTNAYSTPVTLSDNGSSFTVSVTNSTNTATSSPAILTVHQSTLTDLVISEVSTCYSTSVDCWFEIYNPTSLPININQPRFSNRDLSMIVTHQTPPL